MAIRFLSCQAHICLSIQQFGYEVLRLLGDASPHRAVKTVVSLKHSVDYLLVAAAAKWGFPTKHDVHHDTHRPVVTLSCVAAFEHHWCNVVWRAIR